MTTLLLIAACALGGTCCYVVGWAFGRRYGQDEQWVADVLAAGQRDAARRDAQGRFRSASAGGRN